MKNPYQGLPDRAFWRPAVAACDPLEISDLWSPKATVSEGDAVATYGSCFAQHIGRALHQRGFSWLISEAAPQGTPEDLARRYNYGIFSSRTGNIYTASLFRQWISWATGMESVPEEAWPCGDRYIDPFRPAVEPGGFGSIDELVRSRNFTLECFKTSLESANFLVFTLGLSESWINREHGYEYPMCPGTIAGEFDGAIHQFENQNFERVRKELLAALTAVRDLNPSIKVILTVSPVPLTATASGQHVLVATMHSKAILRAVASDLVGEYSWIDYFPSFEMINSPVFSGQFFEANKRNVTADGVAFVMSNFFRGNGGEGLKKAEHTAHQDSGHSQETLAREEPEVCEEALLEAFSGKQ